MRILLLTIIATFLVQTKSNGQQKVAETGNLERILNTLAADEMRGRSALKPEDIGMAADFISSEFKKIGLQPFAEDDFRQTFRLYKVSADEQKITILQNSLDDDQFLISGNIDTINWNQNTDVKFSSISDQDDFSKKFRESIYNKGEAEIIWVNPKHQDMLNRFKRMLGNESIVSKSSLNAPKSTKVFIIASSAPADFEIFATANQLEIPLFNVVGMIPGKSKPEEYVVFSSHYDHIGILEAQGQDSIANGADDDASGTTAVIALAEYYKTLDKNERTLIFACFTGEEIGMYGSKYFSNNINPDSVIAMLNIEMIGKDSKFGPNSLYMTGFDASNLGTLMQENVKGTSFTFHPDPYPQQNLFYRSDNATLAALGVPAHTFSTVQIDKDGYYHTVKDEVSTLDIENIKQSIDAIAHGAQPIVEGKQTPSRVEKLRE